MTVEQIISLISVIVAALALLNSWHLTRNTQRYDKERFSLNIYADFLSICYKISTKSATESEKTEFMRCNAKLLLIADDKLKKSTSKLADKVYNCSDSEELSVLVKEEMNLMRERLHLLNSKKN